MTSKRLLLYYSMSGNTKAMLPYFEDLDFTILDVKKVESINFDVYDTIVIGTSTWGRGLPPKPFLKFKDDLSNLQNRTIGLFGSGRSEYEHFCGALDLLEELLCKRNTIKFKFKYEGYPRNSDFIKFKNTMEEFIR